VLWQYVPVIIETKLVHNYNVLDIPDINTLLSERKPSKCLKLINCPPKEYP
jgi:hypothetical protein